MTATFSVKNFERFQHYKDRSPPWIKLYNELLDDYNFGLLPDASKWHLVAIWLLASRSNNQIPLDAGWVAKRINATSPVDLNILRDSGFIEFNQDCSVALAPCKQVDDLETEKRQSREETEEKVTSSPQAAAVTPTSKPSRKPKAEPGTFPAFYAAYPLHKARPAAAKAYAAALARAAPDVLLAGAVRYAASRKLEDPKFTSHPATWLNQDRWLDQETPHVHHKAPINNSFASQLARVVRKRAGEGLFAGGDEIAGELADSSAAGGGAGENLRLGPPIAAE